MRKRLHWTTTTTQYFYKAERWSLSERTLIVLTELQHVGATCQYLSPCVSVCVLPNCVSAFLYDPEMRWHDVPLPPHTPHLSTARLLYSSPLQPTGWTTTEIQRLQTVSVFIQQVKVKTTKCYSIYWIEIQLLSMKSKELNKWGRHNSCRGLPDMFLLYRFHGTWYHGRRCHRGRGQAAVAHRWLLCTAGHMAYWRCWCNQLHKKLHVYITTFIYIQRPCWPCSYWCLLLHPHILK